MMSPLFWTISKLCTTNHLSLENRKPLGIISEIGDLEFGEDEIKRVRKTKYLGLAIDESQSWTQRY